MPRNILDDIVRDKRDELRRRQQATPLASLEARCRDLPPARDFEEALRPRATGVGLIAEVKKASPSRGTLAPTLELLPRIPPGHIVVSESGFFTGDQVKRVAVAGAHAVLVGEALVTASDVPAKIRELRAVEAAGAVDASSHSAQTLGAVDASSHAARTGGEMGGASRPPHCS